MGCYVMCDDGLGRCMAIFVYVIMFIGNFVVILTVVMPAIGKDNESTMMIEYFCYLFFWTMMVVSHLSTMCVDPGFIKKGYEYKEDVIAAPFQTLSQVELAFETPNKSERSRQ